MTFTYGISDFQSEDVSLDQFEDYGSMKAYYETWNNTHDIFTEIQSRPCTAEDFGIANEHLSEGERGESHDDQTFFTADSFKTDEFRRKMNALRCFEEPIELIGNFQTAVAQVLFFFFEKCDPLTRTTCKPEEEVKEWMKDKYILFGYNK